MESKVSDVQKGATTKIHVICTSDHCAFVFSLLSVNCHDAPLGRKLIDVIFLCEQVRNGFAFYNEVINLLNDNQRIIIKFEVNQKKKQKRVSGKNFRTKSGFKADEKIFSLR